MLGEFLTWWAKRCGRNWAIIISIAGGLTAIIVLYSTAEPFFDKWRFWTTRDETNLIADIVYPRALADQQTKTLSLQNRLDWLRESEKAGRLKAGQWAEIGAMEDLIRQSKEREAQLIKQRTLFGSGFI